MKPLLLCGLLSLSFHAAMAQTAVSVEDPWVRATVGQQTATGAFMRLTSPDDSRLVQVRSPLAGVVELHEMSMQGDVMRMRSVDVLDLPKGRAVELKPGGYHIMLMDLKAPVKTGDTVTLTLTVVGKDGRKNDVEVKAAVRALNAPAAAAPAGHGAGHKH